MSKKRFDQAFVNFIRQGVEKITPRMFIQTLAERESERAQETKGAIIARVEEVFGSREKAEIWLNEPNRALNLQRPLDLLDTDEGAKQVEEVLIRIEHGVFS
jgi:putative toxin-antitoxin system antitoxin component (TIGR02293 family)